MCQPRAAVAQATHPPTPLLIYCSTEKPQQTGQQAAFQQKWTEGMNDGETSARPAGQSTAW